MFDKTAYILAAKKAKRELEESGQVGYTETAKTVLLDGTFEVAPSVGDFPPSFTTAPLDIKVGDKLSVNWNGKQYTCVAFEIDSIVGFGNLAIVEAGDDTGEPFVFSKIFDDEGNANGMFATTQSGSITVSVTAITETVVPIDPKWLPGVCLPMVELTTEPTTAGAALTEAECAQMDKVNGMPFVCKFGPDGAIVGVFNKLLIGSTVAYTMLPVATALYTIAKTDDGWSFIAA